MSIPGGDHERAGEQPAPDHGDGRQVRHGGELAPRQSGSPNPAGNVPTSYGRPPPPVRPPMILQTRPVGPSASRLTMVWTNPLTIVAVLLLILLLAVALIWALLRPGSTGEPVAVSPTSPSPSSTPSALRSPIETNPPGTAPVGSTPSGPGQTEGLPGPTGAPAVGAGLPATPSGPGTPHLTGNFGLGFEELDGRSDLDVEVTVFGITGQGGAVLTRFTGTGRPTLPDCAGIPLPDWTAYVPSSELRRGAIYCYVTDASRYGYFTVQNVMLNNAREVRDLDCAYLTWRGLRD